MPSYAGPAWNNFIEYPSLASNEYAHDRADAKALIAKITATTNAAKPLMDRALGENGAPLSAIERDSLILQLQAISELREQANVLVQNLFTFVSCERSIDARDDEATKAESQVVELMTDLQTATKPSSLFLDRAPEEIFELYLKHPHTVHEEFAYRQSRKMRETLLSEKEEVLLAKFRLNGPSAFGELYDQIAGSLKCRVQQRDGSVTEMGLAQASGLVRDGHEPTRKAAWHAIQESWKTQEIPCAAILNALAGWRLEEARGRSHTRPVDFLEFPLFQARIQRETLHAMLDAVKSRQEISVRANLAIAHALGKDQLDPWDIVSSAPSKGEGGRRTFKQGLTLIHDALAAIDPSMGDFVSTMEKNQWIDGRVLPTKKHGAYCTEFIKSRTPRVFQTYMGSISDIRTLAHELGHAYHSWAIRDLPLMIRDYPMTLAETASIFAETAFSDQLFAHGSNEEKFEISWQNVTSASAFLANIPARFEFEKNFYEKRAGGFVSATELSDLTDAAWRKWYGDAISLPERQYWMTKLHFSISTVSFYNFPYTFGYLFSLGIYAKKAELGREFLPFYVNLLRDTGRMTAEDLVRKHLGEDITQPDFWLKGLSTVERQVTEFEGLLKGRT